MHFPIRIEEDDILEEALDEVFMRKLKEADADLWNEIKDLPEARKSYVTECTQVFYDELMRLAHEADR